MPIRVNIIVYRWKLQSADIEFAAYSFDIPLEIFFALTNDYSSLVLQFAMLKVIQTGIQLLSFCQKFERKLCPKLYLANKILLFYQVTYSNQWQKKSSWIE